MATQKQQLTRALVVGVAGGVLAVVAGVGSQILAAAFGTTLEPVYGWPGYVVVGGAVGAPLLLFALPTLAAAGFRALRDAGVLAILPWGPRK
jgi:hypothetical protein